MRNRCWICTCYLFMCILLAIAAPLQTNTVLAERAATVQSGLLGTGTSWETAWFVVDSGHDGPVVLITGGVHGNEPAGARAAEQIRHWPVARGKLIVVPQVNRLGLAANMRWAPDYRNDRERRDINRSFPTAENDVALTEHTRAVWDFIVQHQPDYVFDLHEGFDFHRLNPDSVGSSVIAFPSQLELARCIQQAVNAEVDSDKQFELLAKSGPVVGSLARACHEQLHAASFILETTFKEQPISLRTRQHRRMASTALQTIGLLAEDCVDRLTPNAEVGITKVAVFDDSGANEANVLKVLDGRAELLVRLVGRHDMQPRVLEQFDVVVFPGGSGSKQGKAIGEDGRENLRQFVRDGGGVLGICAGAYLCTSHYDWSLQLMNASVFNQSMEVPGKGRKSMWFRGPSTKVDVELTVRGAAVLGLAGTQSVRYQNGPILSPGENPSLPEFETWAFFRSENGIYEAQKNTMVGTPAIVTAEYGQGRVIAISPHFESTVGCESVILRALQYVRRNLPACALKAAG